MDSDNKPTNGRGRGRGGGRGRGRGRGRGEGRGGRGRGRGEGEGFGGRGRGRGEGEGEGSGRGGRGRSSNSNPSGRTPRTAPTKPPPPTLKNGDKGAGANSVSEEYRIRLTRVLMELREDDEKERMEFPSTLTNTERKFVHELCGQLGLKSKSTGKGEARKIVVTKMNPTAKKTDDDAIPVLSVGRKGIEALKQHMFKFPPTHTEKLESYETGASLVEVLAQGHDDAALSDRLNQLGLGVKQQAPKVNRREKHVDLARRKSVHAKAQLVKKNNKTYDKMLQIRSQLPAYQHQEEIVRTVASNPVTIVSGETGCGKSTQVPQFLLDANPTWSLVVTQPRRISAISIAERVVEEQCQAAAGGLIGYQVRLDSAVTADTQLVFLTPGVLLRKMQSSPLLKEYTCVIIDEIHERDKYQEFLLIVLRDLLPLRPDLRIVLMSATLQTVALVEFFAVQGVQPAVVEMEGRMFPVQEFFLEKVLEMTGYIDATTGYDGGANFEAELAKLTGKEHQPQQQEQSQQQQQTDVSIQCIICGKRGFADALEFGAHIALCTGISEEETDDDNASANATDAEAVDASPDFSEFADYELEDYDVDGKIELEDYEVHGLSDMKASPPTSEADAIIMDGGSAIEGGDDVANSEVVKWDGESPFELATANSGGDGDGPTQTEEDLLNQYQVMHDDETVDNFLLLEIVQYIVKSSYGDGGILIFFSGWAEISEFSLLLETTAPFRDRSKFLILPLHSGIPSKDQRRVLQRPPHGVRKIVLSTNIAETSLTIDDISFVVDTGRSKEKNYDPHLKTSTLQPTWISQASAKQRKGRAGRVKAGVCFRLFSSRRHQDMKPFTESELLRTPLEEMCLMCKKLELAPGGPEDEDGIPAFLGKAMSAPHLKSVSNALELLVDLGAMQPETNDLTALGECLAVLSLEPRVGKMVIWSYLLGCVRVASDMAVAMSYKSPFNLPQESQRRAADAAKVQLSKNSESDQVTIHNVLEMRNQFKHNGAYNDFCRKNFIGVSTMQMISDLRKNLARELTGLGFPNVTTQNEYHNRHDNDHALWQAAIAAGLYPNIASRKRDDTNFSTMTNKKLKIHMSSVNAVRGQPLSTKCQVPEGELEFMCFGEMVKGAHIFTANQTTHLASPLPLLLLCGTSLSVRPVLDDIGSPKAILNMDDWIVFQCDADIAACIVVLRKRLDSAFWHAVSNPSAGMSNLTDADRDAVEIMGTVLQSAHRSAPSR